MVKKTPLGKIRVPERADARLKMVKYALLVFIVGTIWIAQAPIQSTSSPWGIFGMLTSGNATVVKTALPTVGFGLLLAIMVASLFVERFFCRYL